MSADEDNFEQKLRAATAKGEAQRVSKSGGPRVKLQPGVSAGYFSRKLGKMTIDNRSKSLPSGDRD